MTLIKKLYGFFIKLFNAISEEDMPGIEADEQNEEKLTLESNKILFDENSMKDHKIEVNQMMLTRLYMLRQKILIFQNSFPEKYQFFEGKIKKLEDEYNESIQAIKNELTFEIDPEKDGEKYARIIMLEKDIEAFLEKEVKFDIIIKKLERLIVKLNILYNVSLIHTRDEERNKVIIQTKRAIDVQSRIIQEFKSCEYLLNDMRLKNKIVELISYLDYQIFKLMVRNSEVSPNKVLSDLSIIAQFEGFDYKATFEAYIEDELAELGKLMDMIQDEIVSRTLKKEYESIVWEITYSKDDYQKLIDNDFWKDIFELESMTISILKESGINNIKIKIISRVNISVSDKDVLIPPKVNTFLALTNIFSKTKNYKLTLVTKLLKNISDDISYKEIYFLLILFDVLDLVENVPNEIKDDIEKYLKKYPYSNNEISKKKEQVRLLEDREYVYAFSIQDYESNLVKELEQLNMVFKNVDNKIFLNKIYFSDLNTVINSLETY